MKDPVCGFCGNSPGIESCTLYRMAAFKAGLRIRLHGDWIERDEFEKKQNAKIATLTPPEDR